MALYRRIFPHRDKKGRWVFRSPRSHKKDYNFLSPEVLASHKSWQAPEFDLGQIRLLVFNECDAKGRKLLFDSNAIKRKEQKLQPPPGKGNPCVFSCRFGGNVGVKGHPEDARPNPTTCRPQQTCRSSSPNSDVNNQYVFLRPSSDVKLLGEMMYGSVAMSYRGSTVKVHTIRSPPQLMLSQVFVLKPKENLDPDNISLAPVDLMIPQRSAARSSASESIALSLPVAVPPSSPYKSTDEDSGVVSGSGNGFLTPFPSPGSSISSMSSTQSNSFHRRWMRNQVTSMDHGVRRKSSLETPTVDEPLNRRRHPKIGMGVVISLFQESEPERRRHFQTFFFSHITLFEGHFHRLSLAVEKALTYQRRIFIVPIMDALDDFRSAVHALYCAPRIQRPIWLNMMTYQMQRGHLCEHLVHEMTAELEMHNSKQTNFFFSRLLTAVLMHHLAWVPTVIPAEAAPSRAYLDKHSSTMLDMLAKSHPYNPLWAQLGDIFGAIGFPIKVAKTIVVGRRADIVCRLLYILSYFIRCSEVHQMPEQREKLGAEYGQALDLRHLATADEIAAETDAKEEEEEAMGAKTERVSSDSLDSGLESSGERPSVAGERTDSPAVWTSEGSGEKLDQAGAVTTLTFKVQDLPPLTTTATDEQCSTGNQRRSAMPPGIPANPPSPQGDEKCAGECLTNVPTWRGAATLGLEVGGGSGPEPNSKLLAESIAEALPASQDRPLSGGLYPDLQTILSGTAEGVPIGGDGSTLTPCPSPPSAMNPVPFVQLRGVGELVPKRERIVAVGCDAPMDSQELNIQASVGGPIIHPKVFDADVLDSKIERAVAVGRMSLAVADQAGLDYDHNRPEPPGTKTSPEELVKCESWPGHDRSPGPGEDNQSADLSPRSPESCKAGPSLYPSVDLGSASIEVTPVPSTDNTDTESPDRTPPIPRRNKRFPLTSPLARAHQEALRAKELKLEHANNVSGRSDPTSSNAGEPLLTPCGDQVQQAAPILCDVNGSDSGTQISQPRPLPPPLSLKLQSNDPRSDGDTRGQQTTPVACPPSQEKRPPVRKYQRCFSVGSDASSGYSDTTLTDHEELPMVFSEPVTPESDPGKSYVDNFGRSLLGGYSQAYVADMALHGVADLDRKQVHSDLALALQHSVLDEDIAEAVCIVADTDNWTVELLSSERTGPLADRPQSTEVPLAECIYSLLESVQNICRLRMPSDFCLMHLEDKLQEVYFRSTALASYLEQNPRAGPKELITVLGFEPSDLPLLLSVVSVHSPNVIRSVVRESYEKR